MSAGDWITEGMSPEQLVEHQRKVAAMLAVQREDDAGRALGLTDGPTSDELLRLALQRLAVAVAGLDYRVTALEAIAEVGGS